MNNEIIFKKFDKKSADYHYRQIKKKIQTPYNAYVHARYEIMISLTLCIIKKIKKQSHTIKILDIGCGDGVFLFLLYKELKSELIELYGIDYIEKALKVAQEKVPNGIFKVANAYDLPFENNHFDLIVSSDVIEHISEPKKMLSEIKRVGKNGAYIIIGTPIRYTEYPLDDMHYHEFFPKEFKNLLSEYFNIIKLIQSHPLQYLLLYKQEFSIIIKKMPLYRYFINFLTIYLNKNLFLKIKKTETDLRPYSYLFGIGIIKKTDS